MGWLRSSGRHCAEGAERARFSMDVHQVALIVGRDPGRVRSLHDPRPGAPLAPPPPEPEASALRPQATVAPRQAHAGFVLDRVRGDATGVVEPANLIAWNGVPKFRVRTRAGPVGDLWLTAPASVTV